MLQSELTPEERVALRKRKLVPSKFEDSKFGQIVLALPKNLLRITVCLIVMSFFVMIYVILTERNLSDMIYGDEIGRVEYSEESRDLHPFYEKMQDVLLDGTDTYKVLKNRRELLADNEKKLAQDKNREDKNADHVLFDDWIKADDIDQKQLSEMSPQLFYLKYISRSTPVLLTDGCADWSALETWNRPNLDRLKEDGITAENYSPPPIVEENQEDGSMFSSAGKQKSEDMLRPTYLQSVGFELFSDLKPEPSPHMHSMWVTWIDRLKKYYEVPHCIFDVAEYRDSYLNFDNEASNAAHKPLAK